MKTDPEKEKKRELFDLACNQLIEHAAIMRRLNQIKNETSELNKERINLINQLAR